MKVLLSILIVGIITVSQAAMAETINNRQHNQLSRIGQGIQSGQLTAAESKRLLKQQAHIARAEHRFKSDGQFTRKERARIQHKQTHASRHIFKQKHNAQNR